MSLRRKLAFCVTAGIVLIGTAGSIAYTQTRQAPVTAVWHDGTERPWTPLQCANHLATLRCQQGR